MSTEMREQAVRQLAGEMLELRDGSSASTADGPSYYQIFGVGEDAGPDTLAEAYARLRRRYHPEGNPGDPLAPEIIAYLDSAYAALIDPQRRHAYDEGLMNGGARSTNGGAAHTNGGALHANGARIGDSFGLENGNAERSAGPTRMGLALEERPRPEAPTPEAVAGRARRRSAYADKDLTIGSVPKNVWFLAWPQMVAGSLQTLDTMSDLIWAGRGFGTRAIAGLGAAQQWSQVVMTARMGLDTSSRAMIARAVGAGDVATANHVAVQSFTLSSTISIVAAVLGVLFTDFLLRILGVSDRVVAEGANYMRWQFVASATMAFVMMGGSVLQAAGDTMTPMKAQVVTRIIHLILSPLLMFGLWIFPNWGLAGAAIANAISQLAGAAMNFHALFTGTSRLHLTFRGFYFDWPLLGRMARIGAPASVTGMERALAQLILVGLVTPFGDVALAAYSLTSRVQMIANMGSMGVGQAAGIMVGQNLGAGKPERAKSAVLWSIGYTMAIKAVVLGLIVAFPTLFLSIFSHDKELVATSTTWLYIQAVGFFAMGASMVFMQSFNTAGDTMMPMFVTLISMWGVQQPLAIMLSGAAADWTIFGWAVPIPTVANLGQYGIAWAIVIAMAARLLIYVPYFFWGPWTKKEILAGGRGMGMRGGH